MKGFEVWVAGPWSTLALVWAALAVGTVLGWGLGRRPRGVSRRERVALADAAAERAARQFRRLRDEDVGEATDLRVQAGAATDPQRSTDRSLRVGNPLALPHPRKTSTAAFLDPTPYGAVMFAAVAPELAHEWEPAHVGQALAIANGHDPRCTHDHEEDQDWCGMCAVCEAARASGSPITTGEIQAITEGVSEFLDRLFQAPAPGGDQ